MAHSRDNGQSTVVGKLDLAEQHCFHRHGRGLKVMPVDVSVPGCTCRPEALIDAVGLATEKWRRTRSEEEEMYTGPKPYHEVRP